MRVLEGAQGPRMRVDGREVLLFAGGNYLDLARHPEVVEAAARAARDLGCAAGGSRLIGVAVSLYRLWSAARFSQLKGPLERKLERPYFIAALGKGSLCGAFNTALYVEAAVARGESVASTLTDLK